jgi:AAA domain-containing protein
MNSETPPSSSATLTLRPLRPGELAVAGGPRLSWLWDGYLAPGKVTALISPPKTGKTTLLSHLLARSARGGLLAGRAVVPARALVVSEEAATDWDARCRRLSLGQNVQLLCRPFPGARPTDAQWFSLVAGLEALHRQEALDLVVLDALAALLPGHAEAYAPRMLDCLLPLQALASRGPAVWLLHHPAKGRRADGQAARGSGALPGFADIVMEMGCLRRARSRDRRRRICAYSHSLETPRHLILELNADGTDYLVRSDAIGSPLAQPWPEIQYVLAHASDRLTQQTILERWPVEGDPPNRSTLSRWLKRATRQGVVCCRGSGYRGDPLRYWLPGREALLWPGDRASEEEKQAWRDRCTEHYRKLREQPPST